MTAVDTNVLFYVHDFRDVRKQQLAAALLPSIKDGALLWQVACEYLWASRKLQPQGYSYADAVADINELRTAWEPILPAWSVIDNLGDLKKTYGFSHWDSLLVGTCIVGCQNAVFRGFR